MHEHRKDKKERDKRKKEAKQRKKIKKGAHIDDFMQCRNQNTYYENEYFENFPIIILTKV